MMCAISISPYNNLPFKKSFDYYLFMLNENLEVSIATEVGESWKGSK